ncbi:MAG: hypothetical protein GWN87_13535, partial [Desulfuromonadales bacterium]|nr:hypothetical protein [Desulfuromonadales bacterium]NIS41385.1 hypothetical protein [Desulfuromonadales bacterium]
GKGIRVVIGLYLKNDYKVICYLNSGGEVGSENAGSVLSQAKDFCESLGFMMNDLEIHKMDSSEKNDFWESQPLKSPPVKPKPAPAAKAVRPVSPEVVEEAEELSAEESVELDLGLPRRRLAVQKKKERPSPAELEKKRDRLRENLGRFLSSL